MSGAFGDVSPDDLARLIAAYPLAWIVAPGAPACATPMPLLLERTGDGAPASLLGHLPNRHPLVAEFAARADALFLFQGPQGYITPEYLTDKDWAPTWNFAVAAIEARVTIDPALTEHALEALVGHMERDRTDPWATSLLGPRYADLRARVTGFRATITTWRARFKLGQDESAEVFDAIENGLGDSELAAWMRLAR